MSKKQKKNNSGVESSGTELNLRKSILLFMGKNPGKIFNPKQISAGAELTGTATPKTIGIVLDELVGEGKLESTDRAKYRFLGKPQARIGKLEVVRDGFGFIVTDDGSEDLFVGSAGMGKALNGDTVSVRIIRRGRKGEGRSEAEVIEIIQRANTRFVGKLQFVDRMPFLVPDDQRISTDFIVTGPLKGARENDKVIFELKDWSRRTPEAEIVEVLGKAGEHETEMHAIIFQFGFREAFPLQVENEANSIPKEIPESEIQQRRDFRNVTTFTIDPVDAKDFDDALSLRKLDTGNWEIGVHIADVSYYVRPGTALDQEAFDRATSVYLVDRTVPMLPEALSNDMCSLKPNVDRLAFSAVFEMTMDGAVLHEWFGRTIIHSDKRFAYEEAQEVLDKGEGIFYDELKTLNTIAYALREKRFREGSINFEEDEVKFQLDEKGVPIRIIRKIRRDTNKLIEDFMLLANRRVATWVNKLRTPPLPFVYRIHDSPDPVKLEALQHMVASLGFTLDLSTPKTIIKSMNALMTAVEGTPEQNIVQNVAVRAMAKAIYDPNNIGHYGLGFEYYTHFTSPIRRYPDLMVHRFMAQYLNKEFNYTALTRLPGQTKHCSNMEKKAAEAERASIKYKQVEYLSDKVGQEFEGIISGVTRWGLYVELIESKSDGMIPMAELSGDYYEVDEKNFRIVGRNTGEVINMGDRVMVQVKSTSLMLRQIEFSLVDILSQPKRNIPDYVPGFREEPRRKGSSRSRNAGPKSAPKKGKGGGRNTGLRIESKGKRNAKGGKRK